MHALELLLQQVAIIDMKYQKIEKESRSSFNIFSILRSDSDEVGLHSSFIAELLDPRGTHKMGRHFQALFFEAIDGSGESCEKLPIVQTEVAGTYGRIDILMRGKNARLVLENKIYAPDQDKQLQRYYDFFRSNYPRDKLRILYLTLFGDPPSANSRGTVPEIKIETISYRDHILQWLEACAKDCYQIPHLRESLIQYIFLVKKLTGQTISEEHKMELVNLLLQGDNLESALELEKAVADAKIEVQRLVWQELIQTLSTKGYLFNFVDQYFSKKDEGHCKKFYAPRNRAKLYGIEYKIADYNEFSLHLYLEVEHRLYYGFTAAKNGVRGKYGQEIRQKHPRVQDSIRELADWDKTGENWWLAWKYTEPRVNFMTFQEAQTYAPALANPKHRKKWVEEMASQLANLIEAFNTEHAGHRDAN